MLVPRFENESGVLSGTVAHIRRIRKNEEELGLLASEEDRKFGSKDQNQIWNRVSKRVFCPRRKGKDSFDYGSSSSNSWVLHVDFQLAC
jgi:hypothetical protein